MPTNSESFHTLKIGLVLLKTWIHENAFKKSIRDDLIQPFCFIGKEIEKEQLCSPTPSPDT